ncbi:nucleobase:cation symporter-1, NCS1 family [Lacicoccus qingdaonensis]|uniref:Nucleobase:cation symporter-1, NCS1 family n=2 Tax=Lacicoccus qingdaonensis TaxID=576118 RepID=A0A1G9JA72_9BACL|nr:nucleobase:cation symporter-1, NCS1 family [Salinicoccus qingdaonensis]
MSSRKKLIDGVSPDPSLYNSDLAPVEGKNKNWTWWNFSALWMGIVANIVAWEVAANLIAAGMSFWQALACVSTAYFIAFIAILLNSFSGAKYGVPFPVLIRASFGTKGSQVPVFLRAGLGVFWFGVHMYISSMAVNVILSSTFQGWANLGEINILGLGLNEFLALAFSFIIHAYVIKNGMGRIRRFEGWAGPVIMIVSIGLVIWALNSTGGMGNITSTPSTLSGTEFWSTFFIGMTALLGTVATLMLNIADITKHSRTQKDHIIGQGIGMPIMFILFSIMALITTFGTMSVYGEPITNPIYILAEFDNPIIVIVGAAAIFIATLSTNIATNAIAVGYDLTNLLPKKLNFQKSGFIALIIGVISAPWLWYEEGGAMDVVLGAIGSTMAPVLGIMLVDFFIIRRFEYNLSNLYRHDGVYGGWNKESFIAFGLGIFAAFIGLFIPQLSYLYDFNWFIGVGVAAITYTVIMWPKRGKIVKNETIRSGNVLEKEETV